MGLPDRLDSQAKAPVTAQGQQAHQASPRHQERHGRGWHAIAEAAQLGEVLAVGGGNHAAHAHKQQGLGQAVGEQQQQGHGRLLQGDGDEDQAQIGGGGIGKGALEIHLG